MSPSTPVERAGDSRLRFVRWSVPFLLLFVTAFALGWLASLVGQFVYLVLFFPVAVGLALALVGRLVRVRRLGVAALLGLSSAAVALLTMHYLDYQRFMSRRDARLAQLKAVEDKVNLGDRMKLTPQERVGLETMRQQVDDRKSSLLAVDSFSTFLHSQAAKGATVGHRRIADWHLGYAGTWAYWGLELLGVAVLAALGPLSSALGGSRAASERFRPPTG
jgi:hypothetical protein